MRCHYLLLTLANALLPPIAHVRSRHWLYAERRVWQSRKLGSIDALQLATAPIDDAAADACTIAVRAIGLNYADIFSVLGLYSAANEVLAAAPASSGFVPGLEFAGVVEDAGPEAP